MIVRLVLAAILGAMIGLERGHHGRTAGLRTQLLVALGAALATTVGIAFGEVYAGSGSVDPSRIAYGVMGGIGFLGAGVILRQGATLRGVTTAASLWCTAAIVLACGVGMLGVATFSTALVLLALLGLARLDPLIAGHRARTIRIICRCGQRDNVAYFRRQLGTRDLIIRDERYSRSVQTGLEELIFRVEMRSSQLDERLDWFPDDPQLVEFSVR